MLIPHTVCVFLNYLWFRLWSALEPCELVPQAPHKLLFVLLDAKISNVTFFFVFPDFIFDSTFIFNEAILTVFLWHSLCQELSHGDITFNVQEFSSEEPGHWGEAGRTKGHLRTSLYVSVPAKGCHCGSWKEGQWRTLVLEAGDGPCPAPQRRDVWENRFQKLCNNMVSFGACQESISGFGL